jgi:hypothetical protein
MSETSKLPIKVVPTLERDFYRPEVSGGPPKVFGEVNKELMTCPHSLHQSKLEFSAHHNSFSASLRPHISCL